MASFIAENWLTFVVGAIVIALIAVAVIAIVRDRKKGGSDCCGKCGSCPYNCENRKK